MSSQKGNARRTRSQKHQNKNAFKNSMHDTSKLTQSLNSMVISNCCQQCKDVLEWKIRYKKYKPLTVPKKCTNCQEKRIKRAYYILCDHCTDEKQVCGKCGKKKEIISKHCLSAAEEAAKQSQLEQELRLLPERKRRAFFRLQASGQLAGISGEGVESRLDGEDTDDDEEDGDDAACKPSMEDEGSDGHHDPASSEDEEEDEQEEEDEPDSEAKHVHFKDKKQSDD